MNTEINITDITEMTDAELDELLEGGDAGESDEKYEFVGWYNLSLDDYDRDLTDDELGTIFARYRKNGGFVRCDHCGTRHKSGMVAYRGDEMSLLGNTCGMKVE